MNDVTQPLAGGGDELSVRQIVGELVKEREPSGQAAASPQPEQNAGDDPDPADLDALEAVEIDEPSHEAAEDNSKDDFKVRLRDGREVSVRDLKKFADYEPKIAEYETKSKEFERFAQERQQFEAQRGEFTQTSQTYKQAIDAAIIVAEHYLPKPPSNDLLKTDPFAYMEQKADYEARNDQLRTLQQQRASLASQEARAQQENLQKHIAKQQTALLAAKPELKDPVKAAKFWEDVKQLGASIGFSPQEMGQIPDYRFLLLAEKAMKFDRIVAQKAKLAEKSKNAEPMVVQPAARRVSAAERSNSGIQPFKDKLDQSGSIDDAVSLLIAERSARR